MRETPDGIDVVHVRGNRHLHWSYKGSYYTLCGYASGDLVRRPGSMPICARCVREWQHPTSTPTTRGER